MEIHHAASAAGLARLLKKLWSGTREDPFSFDLAVVPSAGFRRWISQQLALGSGAEGICAGVEFTSTPRLWARLGGSDDPWRPERLAWLIQQIALDAEHPAELDLLRRHLDASRQTYSATTRIARHFSGYADHLPGMLSAWAKGEDIGPDGKPLNDASWQAYLWRRLVAQIGLSPLEFRSAVLTRLGQAAVADLPERIAVLAPFRLDPGSMELFEALSNHHQVDLLLLSQSPTRRPATPARLQRRGLNRPSGHPLNLTLGMVADENATLAPPPALTPPQRPETLLGRLQGDLFADRVPTTGKLAPDDKSVQVHLSHGPARQVEVLREVLAEMFADNPTLEPRDIAVITPDLETFGPLLDAAFSPQEGVPTHHPAQYFRLQLAERSLAQANPLVEFLLELLRLPDSRLEASTLLELCASEPVARRFGFTIETRQRLAQLVESAGIRWGLNPTHRSAYGLGHLAHNTWLAGLQRMLLGVALSEQDLVSVGTALPLDDVDSSDVQLIGGLTELIGRLSRWLAVIVEPASLADWIQRCRDGLDSMVSLPPNLDWQRSALVAKLAELAEASGAASGVLINRHAALAAIESGFGGPTTRGTFGNGSAIVAGLESLRHVPHRVVILLGWDQDRYPRSGRRHGDDLLGIDPPIGSPSASLADRESLLAAVHAADEKLILVGRGRSEATNAEVSLPAPIAEFLDALDLTALAADGGPASKAVITQHPLQPFAAEYFATGNGLHSVDPLAYRAAIAGLEEPAPKRDRFHLEVLPAPDLSQGVNLDELTDFFRHPARALMKARAGLVLSGINGSSEEIPIEPDALERWQIGNRVLRRLQEGAELSAIERAEWLRGQVPPFELGRQLIGSIAAEARRTLAAAPPPGELTRHDLRLRVPMPEGTEVSLVAQVTTTEGSLSQTEFSSLQPRHKLSSWLRLLMLAATTPGRWDAKVTGKGYRARYLAPSATSALDLLSRYLSIYSLGLTRPLPALPRLTAEWANLRATGRDPADPHQAKSLRRCWDWESDAAWGKFFSYPQVLQLPRGELPLIGADPSETTLVGALASSIWTPILDAEVAL